MSLRSRWCIEFHLTTSTLIVMISDKLPYLLCYKALFLAIFWPNSEISSDALKNTSMDWGPYPNSSCVSSILLDFKKHKDDRKIFLWHCKGLVYTGQAISCTSHVSKALFIENSWSFLLRNIEGVQNRPWFYDSDNDAWNIESISKWHILDSYSYF